MVDIDKLDHAIQRGIADAEAGRLKSAREVFERLDAKYRALAEEQRKENDSGTSD